MMEECSHTDGGEGHDEDLHLETLVPGNFDSTMLMFLTLSSVISMDISTQLEKINDYML